MTREVNITPYKRAVLKTLELHKGTSKTLGDNPSHFERACREMEQAGLVGRNLHDVWYIKAAGRAVVE
jgi:hypothetical protein